MPFDTPLTPQEIPQFEKWKQRYAPQDSGQDYDFRGAYKAGLSPDPATGHWPDTFKKPNHPTFSDQSIYSSLVGTRPGTWEGDTYRPFGYQAAPQSMGQTLGHVIQAIQNRAGSGVANPSLFHEPTITAGQGMGAAIQATPGVLSDPRNAWLGFGPIAGMARPIGPFMRGWERLRETGGFTPPVGHLPNQKYLQGLNEVADEMMRPSPFTQPHTRSLQFEPSQVHPNVENDYYRTLDGLRQLKAERDLALFGGGSAGGAVPPRSLMEDLKDKYGFGYQPPSQ